MLYAPTWEGWTDDPGNTSVVLAGENIVRALLADPGVRLLYKPHPMTGSVDPRAGAANERIQAMIAEANAERGGRPAGARGRGRARAGAPTELDQLTTHGLPRAARTRWSACAPGRPGRRAAPRRVAAATAAWEDATGRRCPTGSTRSSPAPRPGIYSCFNQADLLISDVSSVVSDYLASEKPYAVANTSGLSEEEFRAAFPTVRAATVLTPEAAGSRRCWSRSATPEKDTLAAGPRRAEGAAARPVRPAVPGALQPGRADAVPEADERRARMASRSGPTRSRRSARPGPAEEAPEEPAVGGGGGGHGWTPSPPARSPGARARAPGDPGALPRPTGASRALGDRSATRAPGTRCSA